MAKSASVEYTSPGSVVLFIVLIALALLYERGKRLAFSLTAKHYQAVLHAFFEELSTFGFISLLAFIFEKQWNGDGNIMYMIGNSVYDGYGSVEEQKEEFVRLLERFVDPLEALPGDIVIPRDFNLGEYFVIISSRTMASVVQVSAVSWMGLIVFGVLAWLSHHFDDNTDDPHWAQMVFWIYEGLLLVAAVGLHYDMHRVLKNLVPVYPETASDKSTGGGNEIRNVLPPAAASKPGADLCYLDGNATVASTSHFTGAAAARSAGPESDTPAADSSLLSEAGTMVVAAPSARENDPAATSGGHREPDGWRNQADRQLDVRQSFSATAPAADVTPAATATITAGDRQWRLVAPVGGAAAAIAEFSVVPESKPGSPKTRHSPALRSRPYSIPISPSSSSPPAAAAVAGTITDSNSRPDPKIITLVYNRTNTCRRTASSARRPSAASIGSSGRAQSSGASDGGKGGDVHLADGAGNDTVADELMAVGEEGADEMSSAPVQRLLPAVCVLSREDEMDEDCRSEGGDVEAGRVRAVGGGADERRRIRRRGTLRRALCGESANPQERLFLLESRGPELSIVLARFILLSAVVMCAASLEGMRETILCTGADECEAIRPTAGGVILLIVSALVPATAVVFLGGALRHYVVATSVERMKRWDVIVEVIAAGQRRRDRAAFSVLVAISAAANRTRAALPRAAEGSVENSAVKVSCDWPTFRHAIGAGDAAADARREVGTGVDPSIRVAAEARLPNFAPRGLGSGPGAEGKYVQTESRGGEAEHGGSVRRGGSSGAGGGRCWEGWHGKNGTTSLRRSSMASHLRTIFNEVDNEGTGKVDRRGLALVLRGMGAISDEETGDRLFELMDLNRDEMVSFAEFEAIMTGAELRLLDADALASQIWAILDPDGTGQVETDAITDRLRALGAAGLNLEEASRMLRRVDEAGEGLVTRREFYSRVGRIITSRSMRRRLEADSAIAGHE